MLTTKRYDYVLFEHIALHPDVANHRPLDLRKVAHYQEDIHKNGLLEPLVVWEKRQGEFFLVGGFHRRAAIHGIRERHPGHFDRVDVRVVDGDLEEIRALNLKLNADRLDTKIGDYFDTVIYLNNANWSTDRIAQFLDKSVSWVTDLLRYVPGMPSKVRQLIDQGRISWSRAKAICRAVQEAPAGEEETVLARELAALTEQPGGRSKRRPVTLGGLKKRLTTHAQRLPSASYTITTDDLLSLVLLLEGKNYGETHTERVRQSFPGLLE